MARSFNQVIVVGVCGVDPDIRNFGNGGKAANVRLAVDDSYKGKDGNWVDRTEWIPVSVIGDGLVGIVERTLHKGSRVQFVGQFKTRQWEKDGEKRFTTEVVVGGYSGQIINLDPAQKQDVGERNRRGDGNTTVGKGARAGNYDLGDDQDLPF